MNLVECTAEHIKKLKEIASQKTEWNRRGYNPSSLRLVIEDDDGNVNGFIQAVPALIVEEFYVDQSLPLLKRMETFKFGVKEFLESIKLSKQRLIWTCRKDHKFASKVYSECDAGKVNYRHAHTWVFPYKGN